MQKDTKDSSDRKSIVKNLSDKKNKQIDKVTAKSEQKKVADKTTKKASTAKKTATKKSTPKTAKVTTSKSASKATKKSTTSKSKTTSTFSKKTNSTKKIEVLEYYDMPYRYNQTVVRILAQTPNTLFVYWDISDEDRKKYIEEFGENFFDNTIPVLIVHNRTMNYSFEIEINDFANSWYFNINDSKCDYEIELGRKAKQNTIDLPNNYIQVTSSNKIEAPNNHILFEQNQKTLFFRNIKTNTTVSKDVSKIEFMKYAGRVYNIYNVYKEIYKHEELQDLEKLSSSSF